MYKKFKYLKDYRRELKKILGKQMTPQIETLCCDAWKNRINIADNESIVPCVISGHLEVGYKITIDGDLEEIIESEINLGTGDGTFKTRNYIIFQRADTSIEEILHR